MKNKEWKIKAGFGFSVTIISVFVALIFIFANVSEVITNNPTVEKGYMRKVGLQWLGEQNLALNISGVLEGYIWKNGGTYTANLSNISADCYEHGDVNNTHFGSDVRYNTAFDVAFKVQVNYSHGFNETSGWYDLDYMNAWANCSDLSISSILADEYHIVNVTEQAWIHFVWDNSGAGYQISRGQNITSFYIDFEFYYVP